MPTDTNPTPSTAMPQPLVHITHDLLARLGACEEHRDIFDTTFPDGVTLTTEPDVDTVTHIVASGLDVDWLCQRVLSSSAYAEYESAVEAAWAEYDRTIDEAWANRAGDQAQYGHAVDRGRDERARAFVRAAWHALADRKNWRPRYWHLL